MMDSMGTPAIHCHKLSKRFGGAVALDDFELEVPTGSLVSLLGPSGCGKTTALRLIAGFERPDKGSIEIGGRVVVDDAASVPAERRRVGMVFQDHALFPHMTVTANVAYGLSRAEYARVAQVLNLVGLHGLGERMPHELSGGEQQRVALARALAPQPDVVLLDEPFSSLDATLRERMRRDVRRILTEAGATVVFVTHDQHEALAFADIIAVMRQGSVLQVGTPTQVYRQPNSPWIAGFVGESEIFEGHADVGMVETELGTFPQFGPHRGEVLVLIRPEWIHPTPADDGLAVVIAHEFYGHDQLLLLELGDGRRLTSRLGTGVSLRTGDRVDLGIDEVVVFAKHDGGLG